MTKIQMLQQLARERCGLRVQGFGHPEDFPKPDRKYDFRDFVTPYTKGAGQVDSEIMIVLQDWSSADKLETQGYNESIALLGRDPALLTNKRLEWLLWETCGRRLKDVYATNAFPLIKTGGISAPIPRGLVRDLAERFLAREAEIVSPRYIFALGGSAARALRLPAIKKIAAIQIIRLPHPAARWSDARMRECWHRILDESGFSMKCGEP